VHPWSEPFHRRGLTVVSVPYDAVALRPLEGAKTVLLTALPYYFPREEGQNLARFAALPDYHTYFGALLQEICGELNKNFPELFFRPFTDNSPIDEQKAALMGGLAAKGKNNLCTTSHGSFVFLGEIVTDGEVSLTATPPRMNCDGCNACIRACPNGALTEEGFRYDRCLAYITQKKGDLTEEERQALQNSRIAWGCDRCAEACPHNRDLPTASIALPPNTLLPRLERSDLEGLSDRQYREKYAGRAFAWRGKATMIRNLTILEECDHGKKEEQ